MVNAEFWVLVVVQAEAMRLVYAVGLSSARASVDGSAHTWTEAFGMEACAQNGRFVSDTVALTDVGDGAGTPSAVPAQAAARSMAQAPARIESLARKSLGRLPPPEVASR